MQRLFFSFPAGLPGAGLLLLRLALTLIGLQEWHVLISTTAVPFYLLAALRILSFTAILSVIIGLATPIGCLVIAMEAISAFLLLFQVSSVSTAPGLLVLNLAVMAVVIAAVGPGAFSLDARLFGRREIVFPD